MAAQHSSPKPAKGWFITFEGIDGAGKSSQIDAAKQLLSAVGYTVVVTREPGGTPVGEQLRTLALAAPMGGATEMLIMFAARREHIEQVIAPAIAAGHAVLCDRFADATYAYQVGGRGESAELYAELSRIVLQGLTPDLTLLFDCDETIAAARLASARAGTGGLDKFERENTAFFARVRAAYHHIAQLAPARVKQLDATQPAALVRAQVEQLIRALLQADRGPR